MLPHSLPRRSAVVLTAAAALLLFLALAATASARKPSDRDRDGLPDRWERKYHLSTHAKQRAGDPDHDGLGNWGELRSGTNPRRADSDRDGIGDAAEDRDRDNVDNGTEIDARTDPAIRDTDRDRVPDGREDPDRDRADNAHEDDLAFDPRDADSDDDGTKDGAELAGVVRAFDGARISIDLVNGTRLDAAVDEELSVACSTEDEWADADEQLEGSEDEGDDGGAGEEDEPSVEDEGDDGVGSGDDEEGFDATAATTDDDFEADDPETDADAGACLASVKPGTIVHDATVLYEAAGAILIDIAIVAEDD